MSPFNLDDYEPVEERLARFWQDHPNGRVYTELVNGSHAGESVIMLASVYKDKADLYPDATGHAQESRSPSGTNKMSWVENCETSAIGRALANMGYAPKGARPSREEMTKAVHRRLSKSAAKKPAKRRASHIALFEAAKAAGVDDELRHRISRMLTGQASTEGMSDADADKVTASLAWFQLHRETGMERLEKWEAENGVV